jgi:APA family basic amino acid/polyamine antiporter
MLKGLFATKSLEMLAAEAKGENRLRRILGPIGLTSLGVGAIIGAGIFVMTGREAANVAGPGILISFAIAGVACTLAAFCYAEFASMAPVAGSAYTYAYATLGELIAWIIGWDLVLEYAMSGATVASAWTEYFNEFMLTLFDWQVPKYLSNDPFTEPGAIMNLPAVLILVTVTAVLVIGIRESAMSNTFLVVLKVGVVVFVVVVGVGYVNPSNWTDIPYQERRMPEEVIIPDIAEQEAKEVEKREGQAAVDRTNHLTAAALAVYKLGRYEEIRQELKEQNRLTHAEQVRLTTLANAARGNAPSEPEDQRAVASILEQAKKLAPAKEAENWGLLGMLGLRDSLVSTDNATRTNFTPYGLSGLMLGAAIVFFAFIGFDSISTHAEEAVVPQRDVPFGIIASLLVCTVLYVLVSAVITGMTPYPEIDTKAAVASAFRQRSEAEGGNALLHASAALIAAGGLAGMTSVLLITFLSQARIFLAMARDGLLPQGLFGSIHEKFRTPHISTMATGGLTAVIAAFTPIQDLEKMVNIGTLFAFTVVSAAVLILRLRRPDADRPFRCPALFVVAPLGIVFNVVLMLFLPLETWLRLVVWLIIGLILYFSFGYRHSVLRTGNPS